MKIDKIVNNNVVTSIIDGQEAVVMGKGLGFKRMPGHDIPDNKVEKIFKLDNSKIGEKVKLLLEEVSEEKLIIVDKIIAYAEDKLDKKMDKLIYVLLADHISFAINRAENDIKLPNPMFWEIKNLYKEEYSIGLWALEVIKEYKSIRLPEDEAAFIALHIVNSSLGEEMYNTMNITILTKDILRIIKHHFKLEFNEDSLDYIRLVTHLKFFSQRIFKRQQVSESDDELFELLSLRYAEARKCIDKISKYVKREFDYNLTNQELIYLILHIQRVNKK